MYEGWWEGGRGGGREGDVDYGRLCPKDLSSWQGSRDCQDDVIESLCLVLQPEAGLGETPSMAACIQRTPPSL